MKLSSKLVSSSPGRPENFAPPLTRSLLSSNGRSRSRRVRSSPMFRRKGVDTPEPGSPKVTCMGQIRVRKSRQGASPRRRRFCLHSLFSSPRKLPNWRKLFAFCFQKKVQAPEYSPNQTLSPTREAAREGVTKAVARGEGLAAGRSEGDFAAPTPPPKNALLLMRCRSEPHRSSVLANQLWGSPEEPGIPRGKGDKEEEEEDEEEEEERGKREGRRRLSEGDRWLERIGRSGPVLLTRCRSEPGRRRNSEAPFWTGTSLGLADACRSPVLL